MKVWFFAFVALLLTLGCASGPRIAQTANTIRIESGHYVDTDQESSISEAPIPHEEAEYNPAWVQQCLTKQPFQDFSRFAAWNTPTLDLATMKLQDGRLRLESEHADRSRPETITAYNLAPHKAATLEAFHHGRIVGRIVVTEPNQATLDHMTDFVQIMVENGPRERTRSTSFAWTRDPQHNIWRSSRVTLLPLISANQFSVGISVSTEKIDQIVAKFMADHLDQLPRFNTLDFSHIHESTFGRFMRELFAPTYRGTVVFEPELVELVDTYDIVSSDFCLRVAPLPSASS